MTTPRAETSLTAAPAPTLSEQQWNKLQARIRASAVHPTASGTRRKNREADLARGYKPLSGRPPGGAEYPRAVVKLVPSFVEGKPIYVAKIWVDYCCPLVRGGRWVTHASTNHQAVLEWAAEWVAAHRARQEYYSVPLSVATAKAPGRHGH